MTPKQFLAILAARWRLALAVFVVTVAATVGFVLSLPTEYTASASVMVDGRSPDQIAGGVLSGGLPPGYLATQVELISSERVARKVIAVLGMAKDVELREHWLEVGKGRGNFEAWLAELLDKKLTVRPAPASNVITLDYAAQDPDEAANVVNAFVKAYIDTSLEFRVERVRQYGGFFDERSKELREALEAAQAKLSDYQQKNALITDDRLDVETNRLAELSSQLVLMQSASAEVAGRQQQARRQPDQSPEVLTDPLVSSLSADLAREEIKMQELTSRLGSNHPQLLEQGARVTELKARLAAATTRAAGAIGFSSGVSQARIAQASSALEAQRARVLRMQRLREQSAALQRDVLNAKNAYDAIQQRVNQSSVESENTYTNVSVLKHATAPMSPTSSKVLKITIGGILAGAALGIGLVLGLELLDRRLRTIEDVAELKQPLLVSLPVSSHAMRLGDTSRVQLIKRRVLTGLPRPKPQS